MLNILDLRNTSYITMAVLSCCISILVLIIAETATRSDACYLLKEMPTLSYWYTLQELKLRTVIWLVKRVPG